MENMQLFDESVDCSRGLRPSRLPPDTAYAAHAPEMLTSLKWCAVQARHKIANRAIRRPTPFALVTLDAPPAGQKLSMLLLQLLRRWRIGQLSVKCRIILCW